MEWGARQFPAAHDDGNGHSRPKLAVANPPAPGGRSHPDRMDLADQQPDCPPALQQGDEGQDQQPDQGRVLTGRAQSGRPRGYRPGVRPMEGRCCCVRLQRSCLHRSGLSHGFVSHGFVSPGFLSPGCQNHGSPLTSRGAPNRLRSTRRSAKGRQRLRCRPNSSRRNSCQRISRRRESRLRNHCWGISSLATSRE